ncbi:MAG: hypothetical protein P4L51_19145 [Puia sp.]|nr:hypothetical protein [Puia sp.]
MKFRSLAIFLIIGLLLVPAWLLLKFMQRVIQPRQSPARLFLYFMGCFLLVVVYTIFLVGLVTRLFPLPLTH